jgi:hypothetical protein
MSIKLVEDYSVTRLRNATRQSLQTHGEQAILLSMYHPGDNVGRCPNCADDIYDGGSDDCTFCYGTGFLNGIKAATRVWALFTDHQVSESYGKRGTWTPDSREMQTEAFPQLMEHDYVVRVRMWDINWIPLEIEGFYGIQQVTLESVRTGSRFGQFYWDITGQKAVVSKIQSGVSINRFPIIGQSFPESSWSATPAPNVPVPANDTKVVVLPKNNKFVAILGDATNAAFDVTHGLGTEDIEPVVRDVATGEVVDPDIFIVDANTIRVQFGEAPTLNQYRLVVLA